jgi:hypothetical protein
MQVFLNNENEHVLIDGREPRKISIQNGSTEYDLSINNFGELVINKSYTENQETAIIIKPSVSNEIRII